MAQGLLHFVLTLLLIGTASAAVVSTRIDQRVSALPAGRGLDVDSDGAPDFVFGIPSTTGDGGGNLIDELQMVPQSGQRMAYMGNSLLQPGMLLGLNLPVIDANGSRGLWWESSLTVSARYYSSVSPGEFYTHLGMDNSEAYLGFRLQPNAGTIYFGYIQFQFSEWTEHPAFVARFAGNPVVVGWALETEPWREITVIPIPEPSIGGLLLGISALSLQGRSRVGLHESKKAGP